MDSLHNMVSAYLGSTKWMLQHVTGWQAGVVILPLKFQALDSFQRAH